MAEPFEKPSFTRSVVSGIGGFIKGALSTALVTGLMAGALVGGLWLSAMPVAAAAVAGAASFVVPALSFTGGIAGIVTGVIKNREAAQVDAQDVINVANIAFAQGVAVGNQTLAAPEITQQESRHFRELVSKQLEQLGPQKA